MNLLFVFIGGMAGAILRLEISHRLNNSTQIPWGTFFANFTGGLLLGGLILWHRQTDVADWLWLLSATGFCGGYTTYSTFSYEVFHLYIHRKRKEAFFYLLTSIGATILGVLIIL
ncbi:fluoride efflux transporter FluC [Halobacillus yeomjeoni]|uniref:Fluoride-specific ion channel FluC n=1 Tax=Halobacillus yeomjeoni TaxID=311194 RepID=A0A931MVU8_9BACI|nr:CrcB family protein [Halobacillus yeomjeoni]MBH0231000.1 CrcB family protein [Halobacillus yeomjeoni]